MTRPKISRTDLGHLFENVQGGRNLGGHGCFNGGVFVVKKISSGRKYVEKKFKTEDIWNGDAKFELFVLRELNHKNIVRYVHGFIDESRQKPKASLYMEYCDKGNLHDLLNDPITNQRALCESRVWDLLAQLAAGVAYMHHGIRDAVHHPSNPDPNWIGVCHRDIKPDNIFICSRPDSKEPRFVIGDFGRAIRQDDDGNWGRQYLGGNALFMPPEVKTEGSTWYTFASDVWTVGAVVAATAHWTNQYVPKGAGDIYTGVLDKAIRQLMRMYPEDRPKMYRFARHLLDRKEEAHAEKLAAQSCFIPYEVTHEPSPFCAGHAGRFGWRGQ